jgi:hypothetical protein
MAKAKKTKAPCRALFLADAHARPDCPDVEFALRQVVELVKRHALEWVVSLGDFQHTQRNRSESIVLMDRFLGDLHALGCNFGFIQGQHDTDVPPWPSGHSNARHLHRQTLRLGNVVYYGLDYQPVGVLQQELDDIPTEAHTLLAHQGWANWLRFEGATQGSFADVPTVARVISGDLHRHIAEVNVGKDNQQLTTISVGAIAQHAINEPSEHFVLLLDDEGRAAATRLLSRPYMNWVPILTPGELDDFLREAPVVLNKRYEEAVQAGVPEDVAVPWLRLTFGCDVPDVVERTRNLLAKGVCKACVWWDELPPPPTDLAQRFRDRLPVQVGKDEALTLADALPAYLDPEESPAAYSLVSRLIGVSKVGQAEALQAFEVEFMGEAALPVSAEEDDDGVDTQSADLL